jgi:undecaprenyl diphosphate synthase
LPKHVAIILDGNGRWAKQRGHERTYGHRFGAENVKTIVREAGEMGIEVLTLYAFSTENWKRPRTEVMFLMNLFKKYLIGELREMISNNVQLHIVGDISVLPEGLRKEILACEADTANNTGLHLNVALNYGGRQEIIHAVQQIADEVKQGDLDSRDITEETITSHLYPSDAMDVDLMIRTGGESRISNFLLWQVSYSELYFTPVLWPDFTIDEFKKAVDWYTGRDRRFGGLTEADS